eukprot:1838896-Pyramimonas_sp.AAC.1
MVELFGPGSFDSWDRSCGPPGSGPIQFGAVDFGSLLNCRTNFHRRFQQGCLEVCVCGISPTGQNAVTASSSWGGSTG